MASHELTLWLDERRWDALEEALQRKGSSIEEHMTQYLIELYEQMVPAEQFARIEAEIQSAEDEALAPEGAADVPLAEKDDLAYWQEVTADSEFRWLEDPITRLNRRGALWYRGGTDGIYIRITLDGTLTIGEYEEAIPHIGEAHFYPKVTKHCEDKDVAFQLACQFGGEDFMLDLFSQ